MQSQGYSVILYAALNQELEVTDSILLVALTKQITGRSVTDILLVALTKQFTVDLLLNIHTQEMGNQFSKKLQQKHVFCGA